MASTFGKVTEYKETEEWIHYVERMNHYFTANEITDENKKRSIFLVAVGAKTYKLLRSLLAPDLPTTKSFDQLTTILETHFKPKPSVIVSRFKFNTRVQKQGESIATFLAELRNLSEHCEFGESLDEMLRDRLVCGVADNRIQRRLLAEPKLTLKRANEVALALETAEKDMRNFQNPSNSQEAGVNKLIQKTPNHREPKASPEKLCYRCKGKHNPKECKFIKAKCHSCGKIGHISRACRSTEISKPDKPQKQGNKKGGNTQSTYLMKGEGEGESQSEIDEPYSMFTVTHPRVKPYVIKVKVNDKDLDMEIDTGASLSVIGENTLNTLWDGNSKFHLEKTSVRLKTYTGEELKPKGSIKVKVSYEGQVHQLPLLVLEGGGPALLGRNWLEKIKVNWSHVNKLSSTNVKLDSLLQKYAEVFDDNLGTLKGLKAKIHVDPAVTPIFHRARSVPYALREKIELELERLQQSGTIQPVQYSHWATPIVPVMKPDGSVRICGDYKQTVNKVSNLDAYPIPKIDDLYTKLAGGKTFSELDLSHAYEQMLLDEESKQYVTINTHKGLFQYNRLPYGVSSAPGIFQRTIDSLLQGIPHTGALLDNVLVTGETEEEHLENLEKVFQRVAESGLRLKRSKCQLMKPSIQCLGHVVDEEGFHPVEAKVRAIRDAPEPSNVSELKSFLGMINFYGKFLPNLSTALEPLHRLLRKDYTWRWGKDQSNAFQTAKDLLQSANVLVHYDPLKELVVSCDASPYGIGAVISHVMEDGVERPIAYASRTLAKAEKGYAQIDKEGLAVVFAVKKFHQFLYGRHFKIYTDHKPLLGLFDTHRAIPPMASSRIQRWALTLSAYEYDLIYRPGKENSNADALSRLPLPEEAISVPVPSEVVFLMENLSNSPTDASKIKLWTSRDPILSQVYQYVLHGWPAYIKNEDLKPYFTRREEISLEAGCLLWGSRVIIPPQGRNEVIQILHNAHPGVSRMKGLARANVWWPKIDSVIEETVKECHTCQKHQKMPAKAPLHPWEWPSRPWTRIHVDYAGPFMGKMFLLIIDAHSKWLEIHTVNTANSEITIEKLRSSFSYHGLPEMIVSDNGSVFASAEFKEFTKKNGIRHVFSAPYHPSTNGLVERAVQTFKRGMKKQSEGSIETKLSRFLLQYRITPQTTTGESPVQLRWGRGLRTHLDLLRPDLEKKVATKQSRQKFCHDQHCRTREFVLGDTVQVRNYSQASNQSKWLPGTIVEDTGPVSAKVQVEDGSVMRRHHDQLLARPEIPTTPEKVEDFQGQDFSEVVMPEQVSAGNQNMVPDLSSPDGQGIENYTRRQSIRERRPPPYLRDYVK